MSVFTIGKLAKLCSCKIATIRYYEEIELLPTVERSEGNQRRYNDTHLLRLNFILHCRALGFNINEIRQLIHLQSCSNHDPHEAHQIAEKHLVDVRLKIHKLESLADELQAIVNSCNSDSDHQCNVLSGLNEP
jgi:MerR family mercuric resistance operon transcriptional regulator